MMFAVYSYYGYRVYIGGSKSLYEKNRGKIKRLAADYLVDNFMPAHPGRPVTSDDVMAVLEWDTRYKSIKAHILKNMTCKVVK